MTDARRSTWDEKRATINDRRRTKERCAYLPGPAFQVHRPSPIVSRGSPAHRHLIDLQRWLADTDRYALAFFAAHADAFVELQIVADHRHVRQHVRSRTDQRRALDRARDPAVFD